MLLAFLITCLIAIAFGAGVFFGYALASLRLEAKAKGPAAVKPNLAPAEVFLPKLKTSVTWPRWIVSLFLLQMVFTSCATVLITWLCLRQTLWGSE